MTIKMYNTGNQVLLSRPWSSDRNEDYKLVLLNGSYAFNPAHTKYESVSAYAVSASLAVPNRIVSKNSLGVYLTSDALVFGGITAVYAIIMCGSDLVFHVTLNAGNAYTFTSRAKLSINWLLKTSQETLNLCPLPEVPDVEPEPEPEPEPEVPVTPNPDPVPEPEVPVTPQPEPEPEPPAPEPEPVKVPPVINSVGGDNRIDINEKDINIAGTELADVYQVAVVGSGKTLYQTIKAKSANYIKFDLSGVTIAGTYQVIAYKLNGTSSAKQVTIVAVVASTQILVTTVKGIKEAIASCKGGETIKVNVPLSGFSQGQTQSNVYGCAMRFYDMGQHLTDYVTIDFGGIRLNSTDHYCFPDETYVGKRIDGEGRGASTVFLFKCKYLHFINLNISDNKFKGYAQVLASVTVIQSQYTMFNKMEVSGAKSYGIIGYNAQGVTIKDCKVHDVGQEAIEFQPDITVEGTQGHLLTGFHILNNEIYNTGLSAPQRGEAIYLGFGSSPHTGFMTDCKVIGNYIHDTKEEAIDIKDSVLDVEILDNRIENVILSDSQNGAITIDTDTFNVSYKYWDSTATPPGEKQIRSDLLYKVPLRFVIKNNYISNITNSKGYNTYCIRVGNGTGIITENTMVGHSPAKSKSNAIGILPVFQNSLARKVYIYNNTYEKQFERLSAYNIWGTSYNGIVFPAEIIQTAPPTLPVLPIVEAYYPSTFSKANLLFWYEGMNFATGGPDITKTNFSDPGDIKKGDWTIGYRDSRTKRWRDRSGNGYHLVASVLANYGSFTKYYTGVNTQKQLLATTNGNPIAGKVCSLFAVVSSDAATQALGYYFGTLGAVNNQSLFVGSTNATTYAFGVDASFGTVSYTETKGKRFIIQIDFTLSSITANIDGVTGSVADSFSGNQNFAIGGGFSDADSTRRHTNSNIFELFALNNPTTLQKTNARAYLAAKWGTT